MGPWTPRRGVGLADVYMMALVPWLILGLSGRCFVAAAARGTLSIWLSMAGHMAGVLHWHCTCSWHVLHGLTIARCLPHEMTEQNPMGVSMGAG
jgi:hypothetical protein